MHPPLLLQKLAKSKGFMPVDSKIVIPPGAEFHQQIAHDWNAGYARDSFSKRLELFNSILDRSVISGQLWLDLGCGSGVLSLELIKRGASVVAMDGSPAMLEAARNALGDVPESGVSFKQGDVQDLSWSESGFFDGVLCSSVIEYVENPDELVHQVARILKEDGLLIISLPPQKSLVRALQKGLRRFFKLFGKDKYPYLEVSRFEVDPGLITCWFASAKMRITRKSVFDPVLPGCLFNFLRPALLICEAQKLAARSIGSNREPE